MYRQLLLVSALFICLAGRSQVSITLQVPPEGVLLKTQLWNMALTYTESSPVYVKISMTLYNSAGDQALLTARTPSFYLNTGVRQLNAASFSPIQYNYLSSMITDHDPAGFLPVGNYQACFTVILSDEQSSTPLAEDCISFAVVPLAPPTLNMPADADTLLTVYPMFTWLPPEPVNLFNNLSYSFNLVEVQQGQSPADAIMQNIPVFSNQNCSDIFINYPTSSMALSVGKQYAWQITALNNLQPTTQSEVWTFWVQDTTGIQPPSVACLEGSAISNLDVTASTANSNNTYLATTSVTFETGFSAGNGFSATVDTTLLPCVTLSAMQGSTPQSPASVACVNGTAVNNLEITASTTHNNNLYYAIQSIAFKTGFLAGNGLIATIDDSLLPCIVSNNVQNKNTPLPSRTTGSTDLVANILHEPANSTNGHSLSSLIKPFFKPALSKVQDWVK